MENQDPFRIQGILLKGARVIGLGRDDNIRAEKQDPSRIQGMGVGQNGPLKDCLWPSSATHSTPCSLYSRLLKCESEPSVTRACQPSAVFAVIVVSGNGATQDCSVNPSQHGLSQTNRTEPLLQQLQPEGWPSPAASGIPLSVLCSS